MCSFCFADLFFFLFCRADNAQVCSLQQKIAPGIPYIMSMLKPGSSPQEFTAACSALENLAYLNEGLATKMVLGGGVKDVVAFLQSIRPSLDPRLIQHSMSLLSNIISMCPDLHLRMISEVGGEERDVEKECV